MTFVQQAWNIVKQLITDINLESSGADCSFARNLFELFIKRAWVGHCGFLSLSPQLKLVAEPA